MTVENMTLKRRPLNGTFELTARCNLSCKMCYVRMNPKAIAESGYRERTAQEWIEMAGQAYDAGTLSLLLTGGEIMLRPDFCQIYESIAKMGFLITVYTNATMVSEEIMNLFRQYPPHKIGVTMYGASNHTYEQLCRYKDGYDCFIDGVGKLATLPSLLDVRTTIVKDNRNDLTAIKTFARNLKIPQEVTISRCVSPAIRGGIARPEEVRLSPEMNVELIHPWIEQLHSFCSLHHCDENSHSAISLPHFQKTDCHRQNVDGEYLFKNCQAGISQYTIDWRGHMLPCTMTPVGYTEPFKDGFLSAWEQLPKQYPPGRIHSKCKSCRYADYCESCPATRMAETGNWYDPPEYSCKEAEYFYNQIVPYL